MRKKIFILSLGLVTLIVVFAIVSRNRTKPAPAAKYIFKSVIGMPVVGKSSSANYKLTAGAIDLLPENEEVH